MIYEDSLFGIERHGEFKIETYGAFLHVKNREQWIASFETIMDARAYIAYLKKGGTIRPCYFSHQEMLRTTLNERIEQWAKKEFPKYWLPVYNDLIDVAAGNRAGNAFENRVIEEIMEAHNEARRRSQRREGQHGDGAEAVRG